jgi:hypothetical protein
MIPTVGVVNWTVNLPGLSDASIEFTLDDPPPGTINVGSGGQVSVDGTTHRALMLGMKAQRTYTYRIVAKGGSTTCTSPDQSFTTGAAVDAPTVTRTVMNAAAQARGFIVTSGGYGAGWQDAYIIDADGDIVWWAPSPPSCGRALMDWEGQNMWMLYVDFPVMNNGIVTSVAMDGTGMSTLQPYMPYAFAHHDLAAAPGGVVAFLVWAGTVGMESTLVERSPDGTLRTVANLDASTFGPVNTEFHANSVMYHPTDDTYTVSDLYAQEYVKISRQGQVLWQLRQNCKGSIAPKCAASSNIAHQHGHHLLDDGHFLFFSADSITQGPVYEYTLTESATTLVANQVWTYTADGIGSDILGDIQRLPNGNTLIDYSQHGEMRELSPTGDIVQVLEATGPKPITTGYYTFGYMNFRETLYGPPLR